MGSRFTFRQLLEPQPLRQKGGRWRQREPAWQHWWEARQESACLVNVRKGLGIGLLGDKARDTEERTSLLVRLQPDQQSLKRQATVDVILIVGNYCQGASIRVLSRPYRNPQQVSKVYSL